MNNDTDTVVAPTPFVLHTRNADDQALIKGAFDLSRIGKPSYVTGLGDDTKLALMKAALNGTKVVSTNLPIDIASTLGEVTLIRAWSVAKADGSTSSGSKAPVDYLVRQIQNREAYDRVKSNPDFIAAFSAEQTDEEETGESDF